MQQMPETLAPPEAPQLIQPGMYGGAVQPSARLIAVGTRAPPQFAEDLHGELFRASGVANDPGDQARHPGVVKMEDRLEIERRRRGREILGSLTACVHITSMLRAKTL